MIDRLLSRRVLVRVFMIAVMIKGKFEESALLRLSSTFIVMVHQRLAADACWHSTLATETYQTQYGSVFSPTILSESCIVHCLSHSMNKEPVILKALLPPHWVLWFADTSTVWMLTEVFYCRRYWRVTGLQFALQIWVQASVPEIFKPPL